ncbi:4-(cytidine 5'-diphospho)-2-C-methyl-D-erythritol kinase [Nanoarchaeota archaeon]
MIELKSYAKVNLTLNIGNKLENGYHTLNSIMHLIDFYDDITIERIPSDKIEVDVNMDIPLKQNLCYKAAKLMRSKFNLNEGVKITLNKKIPIGAGLGGGSSNAASVMVGMNKLFKLNLDKNQLIDVAKEIGSDVPFFIIGGGAHVSGTGELVNPINDLPELNIVLVYPEFEISTALAYDLWDKKGSCSIPIDVGNLNSVQRIASNISNDMQEVIFSSYEGLQDIKEKLIQYGALNASLSGSGPSIFGIFPDEQSANSAAEKMKEENVTVVVTKTILL